MAGPVTPGPTVPPGVPWALSLGRAAKVLNFSDRTVRGWFERDRLPTLQPAGPGGRRYVRAQDLLDFATLNGLPLAWEHSLE